MTPTLAVVLRTTGLGSACIATIFATFAAYQWTHARTAEIALAALALPLGFALARTAPRRPPTAYDRQNVRRLFWIMLMNFVLLAGHLALTFASPPSHDARYVALDGIVNAMQLCFLFGAPPVLREVWRRGHTGAFHASG